jgi:putative ABC transport system permease protein
MMDLRETFSVAIDALRANKVRAMLTSLGVIIGSASIVLVVTVALTSKTFILAQIESIGSNLVWVELVQRPDAPTPLSYEMTLEDLEAVKSIPGVIEVAGTRELPGTLVLGGVERPVNLVGVTEGYQTIRRLLVLRGRYFDAGDMEMRSKVCLITTQLADRVFGQENPVGRPMRLGELTFTVIGVFRERVETFGLSDIQENSVIIPFSLMKYYTGTEVVRLLDAQAARAEDVTSVQRQVSQLLKSRHPPGAEYKVQTLTAILGAARSISLALTIVLIIIAGADTGNRDSKSHWSRAQRDHVPVPDRIVCDQRRRGSSGDSDGDCHPGRGAVFPARKFARTDLDLERGDRFCGVLFHGTFLWVLAGEPGGEPRAGGISAL